MINHNKILKDDIYFLQVNGYHQFIKIISIASKPQWDNDVYIHYATDLIYKLAALGVNDVDDSYNFIQFSKCVTGYIIDDKGRKSFHVFEKVPDSIVDKVKNNILDDDVKNYKFFYIDKDVLTTRRIYSKAVLNNAEKRKLIISKLLENIDEPL
jgi:hypothetical protein